MMNMMYTIRLLLIFGSINAIFSSSFNKSALCVQVASGELKYLNLPLSVLALMNETRTKPILPRTMQITLLRRINLFTHFGSKPHFNDILLLFPRYIKNISVETIRNIITHKNLKISLQQANKSAKLPWLWSRSHAVTGFS